MARNVDLWRFLLRVTGRQSNRTDSRLAAFKEVKRAGTEAATQRDGDGRTPNGRPVIEPEADWKVHGNEPLDEKKN